MANTSRLRCNNISYLECVVSSNLTNVSVIPTHWSLDQKGLGENPLLLSLIIFSVIILFLNGTVFMVFSRHPRLRTATNWILVSLAVSDFSIGLSTPLLITCHLLDYPRKRPYCIATACLNRVFAVSTIYHITLATVEKYMAIVHPFKHISFRKRMIFGTLMSIWMLAAFVAFIPLSWLLPLDELKNEATYAKHRVYSLVIVPLALILPYMFIIYMFVKIFIKASNSLLTRRSLQDNVTEVATECNSRGCYNGHFCSMIRYGHRPLMIFVSMAALFAICWFPYFALELYLLFASTPIPKHVIDLLIAIRYITSIVHPLLYTIIKRDFTAAVANRHCSNQPLQSMTALETIRQHTRLIEGRRSVLLLAPSSPKTTSSLGSTLRLSQAQLSVQIS